MSDLKNRRMHTIGNFDSVSAKHAVYQRELERLAFECEEHLALLRDTTSASSIKYVVNRLEEALERVFQASKQ